MNNQTPNWLIIGLLCGMVVGGIFGIQISERQHRKILIEHKIGYYDISTGKFTIADKTNSFYFIKIRDCVKTNNGQK